jgi:predicted transcriptional regulator
MIKEGLTQSQISSSLHLTQATVSKLELMAKANGEGFDLAFSILEREKIFSDIKNTLIKLAGYTIRAAGGHVKPTII